MAQTREQLFKILALEQKLDAIKELVNAVPKADPDVEYWDSGNYDDAYDCGIVAGRSELAAQIQQILGV